MAVLQADLRGLREAEGLSTSEMAEMLPGVSELVLRRAENGDSTPRPKSAFLIAGFHGMRVSEVWSFERVAA